MSAKNDITSELADFSWAWNDKFFVQIKHPINPANGGNYVWSDPDYGGDNTLTKFEGSLIDFLRREKVEFVRDKGLHIIGQYCGMVVVVK